VFIPLLGMIIGNSLNGISLSLDRFLGACANERRRIESRLALGATPNEAVQPIVREAIRTGMIPMMNAMAIVGVVSLPGMMTGQLLAGADPMDAVLYQIVVMYMIAAAVALGSSMVVLLARRRVFNEAMAVRTDLNGNGTAS
jgi:putative ABC transport system permease protein